MTYDEQKEFTRSLVGSIHYFRNNSSANPTLRHIINEVTGSSFCGFDSNTAEVYPVEETDFILQSEICKKCLAKWNSHSQPTNQ